MPVSSRIAAQLHFALLLGARQFRAYLPEALAR